jgi:hypothetical protein
MKFEPFGISRNKGWKFRTDVSEQPIGPIFRGKAVLVMLIPKQRKSYSLCEGSLKSGVSKMFGQTLGASCRNEETKQVPM